LLGEQGDDAIWANELAQICRTIPYEILTSIHPTIERVYL
jgi:alanine racemase